MSNEPVANDTEGPEQIDAPSIDDLEPLSNEFAAADRSWRGFNLTLQRQIARVTELMADKIDTAGKARSSAGTKLARLALKWRSATGSTVTEITLNNTRIVFYDGDRGELKVLDEENFARWLIEAGLGEMVSISSRPVYAIDKAKAKEVIKANPELIARLASSGAAQLTLNRTVKISTPPTSSEKKRGVRPASFVFERPEED